MQIGDGRRNDTQMSIVLFYLYSKGRADTGYGDGPNSQRWLCSPVASHGGETGISVVMDGTRGEIVVVLAVATPISSLLL